MNAWFATAFSLFVGMTLTQRGRVWAIFPQFMNAAMSFRWSSVLLIPICLATIAACGSGNTGLDAQGTTATGNVPPFVQQGLLDSHWTLETVRDTEGQYRPLPLDATWRLSFTADGSVGGDALCNAAGGNWHSSDATLSITDWSEDGAYCPSIETIPIATREIVQGLLTGATVMPNVNAGRLFLDAGDNTQLVFSGLPERDQGFRVSVETLLRTPGFTRASDGSPVFGELSSPFVVYRDHASLDADYALLPAEDSPLPALPTIDFSNSIVIGAYLPLDGSVSSDVFVRGAWVDETGLDIAVSRFDSSIPDEASIDCAAADALTAPWTLVRIDSVAEPVRFSQMRRAYCSGIPTAD